MINNKITISKLLEYGVGSEAGGNIPDNITHRGMEIESSDDGDVYVLRYTGRYIDIASMMDEHYVREDSNLGYLKNIRLYQEEGPLWTIELRYEATQGWQTSSTPPDTSYGKKACSLDCGTLCNELELHPQYKTKWNHYLMGRGNATATPEWWSTATTLSISASDVDKYCWVRYPREAPNDGNDTWRVLQTPTMPGVRSWDTTNYVIHETIRCKSMSAAGTLVANELNKIGTPSYTFGITGGNWKCDSARVHWYSTFWLAELTWTRSSEGTSWNSTLYNSF